MRIKFFNIILGLLIYFTLEDFLLRWLPIPAEYVGYSRFLGELFLYAVFAFFLGSKIAIGRWHKRTPIDVFFYSLILLFIITTIINQVNPIKAVIIFRALIRYVLVFYILVSINIDSAQCQRLFKVLINLAIFQSVLAILQHLLGYRFTKFFLPVQSNLEVAGVTKNFTQLNVGEHIRAIGTFGYTVPLAIFLVFVLAILSAWLFRKTGSYNMTKGHVYKLLIIWALGLTAVFLTYSRASFLVGILGISLVAYFSNSLIKFVRFSLIATVLGLLTILILVFISLAGSKLLTQSTKDNPLSDFSTVLSPKYYYTEAKNNRLWVFENVGGINLRKPNILGYGSDMEQARLEMYKDSGYTLDRVLTYGPLRDIVWISILISYGFVGLFLFSMIIYKIYLATIYVSRNDTSPEFLTLALSMKAIIIIMVLLSFLVWTFEFRPVSFTFWTLSGLIVNRRNFLMRTQVILLSELKSDK